MRYLMPHNHDAAQDAATHSYALRFVQLLFDVQDSLRVSQVSAA